jgi:hypothetical protein
MRLQCGISSKPANLRSGRTALPGPQTIIKSSAVFLRPWTMRDAHEREGRYPEEALCRARHWVHGTNDGALRGPLAAH